MLIGRQVGFPQPSLATGESDGLELLDKRRHGEVHHGCLHRQRRQVFHHVGDVRPALFAIAFAQLDDTFDDFVEHLPGHRHGHQHAKRWHRHGHQVETEQANAHVMRGAQ